MKPGRGKLTELMVLLVFALFALCVMQVLLTGAGVYQKLVDGGEQRYSSRVTAQYIATRVRQAQSVAVEDFGGCQALALGEDVDGECYVTLVYLYDGCLRELYCADGAALEPEDGEKLLPAKTLELSLEGGLLRVTTEDREFVLCIRPGKEVPQ